MLYIFYQYQNIIICDTELISIWSSVSKACCVNDCSKITSLFCHNDIILEIKFQN